MTEQGDSLPKVEGEPRTEKRFMDVGELRIYGDAARSVEGARIEVLGSTLSGEKPLSDNYPNQVGVMIEVAQPGDLVRLKESVMEYKKMKLRERLKSVSEEALGDDKLTRNLEGTIKEFDEWQKHKARNREKQFKI